MRNLKRVLSMTLALVLVLSLVGVNYFVKDASADSYDQAKVSSFTDIDGHWAKTSLSNLIGYGYMYGIGDNKAAPNDTLTTAQLVALLVRIMGGAEEADLSNYADMDRSAWYYTYFAQGMNMGIVPNTNSNYLNPQQGSSREYAAYMLCRAFGLTTREPIDSYGDADKVSDWAVSSMQAMVAAKAITGSNGQNSARNLNPQEIITRGEFAEMVYRLCKNFIKSTDSSSVRGGTIDGGLLIAKSGTKLSGVTVKGNVYISDAVGTGDVTLEDTKVEGNVYVRGSGEHSVHLEGTTTANSVVFLNPYNATRLVVEEEAKINGVLVNNGTDEVILEGNVGNVTINVSDVDLTFEEATATNVIVNSANSTVTVDKDSKVESLTVASSSNGVTVANKGELTRLALMANNAKLDLEGKVDYLLVGAVSGLNLNLSKDIKLTGLDLHCSNSTIKVDSEIGTINVSGFSEKLKLEVDKNAKVSAIGISSSSTDLAVSSEATVGNVTLDAPKYKGTVSSDLKVLTIGAGATEAELTIKKDSDLEVLNVYANKVKVIAEAGSTIKDVNVTGTEASITGTGAIERVNLAESANKASVETPNTVVSNAGAADCKAGGVDLPANKSYTTTSSGKDVVRNNDGTPDGDGDKTTGAAQEVATVANYTLTYASNATPQDIDVSGKWTLDNLGNGLTLTKSTTGGGTYKLTGNVKKVEGFLPVFDPIAGYGTTYYVPVVLEAESMAKETSYTAETGGVRYTSANVSKGTGYNGKLIVFLQLQPGTTNKLTTVTFDRDGTGTAYSPVTVSIDYSAVTFDGAQDLTGELFSYPTKATKGDLTTDGKIELAAFGNLSLANTAGSNMYTVLGTANYVEGPVNGNVGQVSTGTTSMPVTAHHFVPIMVNTTSFQKGWTVVLDGTTRYTASNASTGTGCRGNLILLLPLTATNGMSHTVYLDRDGDGRTDSDGTFTFNCVSVTLSGSDTGTVTSSLAAPVKANDIDLKGTGVDSLDKLGSFGFTMPYLSREDYACLTGTVFKTTGMGGNIDRAGDNWYYPVLVNTSGFTGDWSVASSRGRTFTKEDVVPTGGSYTGHLIIYVALTGVSNSTGVGENVILTIDSNGDGVTDATYRLLSTVETLSQSTGFATIPDYITVALDEDKGTVSIHDTKGDLYLEAEVATRAELAASYIESYLHDQGYTDISHENQGRDTVLFRGTKGNSTYVYSWSRSSGITFTGDPDKIPEGVELEFAGDKIIIHDTKESLKDLSDTVKESIVKKYIVLALTAANYTDIQQTVKDGVITTYASFNDKLERFTTDMAEDVTKEPMPEIEELSIKYSKPGDLTTTDIKMPLESTVEDLLKKIPDANDIKGSYYKHITKDDADGQMNVNSAIDRDTLVDGDIIEFGYNSVNLPEPVQRAMQKGDVVLTIDSTNLNLDASMNTYVRNGEKVTIDFVIGPMGTAQLVDSGMVSQAATFTVTVNGTSTITTDLNAGFYPGVESIEAEGNKLNIVTTKGETIYRKTMPVELTVTADLSLRLSVEAIEDEPEKYNITVKLNGTENPALSQTGVEAGDHTVRYVVPSDKTGTYSIDGGAPVAIPADGNITVKVTNANVTVEIVTTDVPKTYNITVKVDGEEDAALGKTAVEAGDYTIRYEVPAGKTATYSIDGAEAVAVPAGGEIPVKVTSANVVVEITTTTEG